MAQMQLISGVERRRRWSDEQKRAIVAAAFAPGAVVSHVARQADINTGLVYRWRKELRVALPGFAEVVVSPATAIPPEPLALAIEVGLSDGARVHIPMSTPPELAAAILKALVRR
jgi:transposase